MKMCFSIDDFILPSPKGTVITIGNFDGIHRGHQRILKRALKEGKKLSLPSGILTFRDHPRNSSSKDKTFEITSLEQKLERFEKMGFDFCVVSETEEKVLKMQPMEFLDQIIRKRFQAKRIVVGTNFRFGQGARGTVNDLKNYEHTGGYKLVQLPLLQTGGEPVSSTRIRKSIQEGHFDLANHLLRRRVFLTGKVIPGKKIGAVLGFPTANIPAPSSRILFDGIYKVNLWLEHHRYQGVMNVGKAPTFKGNRRRLCEIHILHFKFRILYGLSLTFQVIKRIRDQIKFDRVEDLVEQIKKDLEA
jgi:riboflavin kinase / FMN adenylyltransferase